MKINGTVLLCGGDGKGLWGGVDDQPLCELPGQKLQTALNKNNSKATEPGPAARQPGLSVPTQIVLILIHQRPLPGLRLTSSSTSLCLWTLRGCR